MQAVENGTAVGTVEQGCQFRRELLKVGSKQVRLSLEIGVLARLGRHIHAEHHHAQVELVLGVSGEYFIQELLGRVVEVELLHLERSHIVALALGLGGTNRSLLATPRAQVGELRVCSSKLHKVDLGVAVLVRAPIELHNFVVRNIATLELLEQVANLRVFQYSVPVFIPLLEQAPQMLIATGIPTASRNVHDVHLR